MNTKLMMIGVTAMVCMACELAFCADKESVSSAKKTVAEAKTIETDKSSAQGEKLSAAEQLQKCEFLLNKDFKKDAKVYLCLFSASWCGPCRAEMPHIAKTYVETLKADPGIELIHFSCDRDEGKALDWAKKHDVKFPVVKYSRDNPLNLRVRGIPHLFIVKADGTLLERGHPKRLFNEKKLGELKNLK